NPVGAVLAVAAARRAPGLVATLLAAMDQEHERAAGGWQAEWEPLCDLLRVTSVAAAHARDTLRGLEVHADRMRANLDRTGGLLLAESVTARLAPAIGRLAAHELVEAACRRAVGEGRPLRDVLGDDAAVTRQLSTDDLDAALDPAGYLGAAGAFVDRALAHHETVRETTRGEGS
ncbi:MAG: 3-carboxy-cis,cis-muconate cycloisomerase, partial [Carbonactinosporaceae bacterium]